MRSQLVSTMALVSVLGMGCNFDFKNPAEKEPQGTIAGTVVTSTPATAGALTDAGSGDTYPVEGAVCTLEGTDRSAQSDPLGAFFITGVAKGSYILICKYTLLDGTALVALQVVEVDGGQAVSLGTLELTRAGGISGRAVLAGALEHAGIRVMISGTSYQASTDAMGDFALAQVPVGTYDLRYEKDGYLPVDVRGVTVTSENNTRVEDVILALSTGPSGQLMIAGGQMYSVTRTVDVNVIATPEAALMLVSEDKTFLDATWRPTTGYLTWTFGDDGQKRLYAKFANANGLESPPVSDGITIDSAGPEAGIIEFSGAGPCFPGTAPSPLDGCTKTTNATRVTLGFTARDASTFVSEMKVSTDPTFAQTVWEPFAPIRPFELPEGDGPKTVYATFRDVLGNESPESASGTIMLDTVAPAAPTIELWVTDGPGSKPAYANKPWAWVEVSATEAVDAIMASDDPSFAHSEEQIPGPGMTRATFYFSMSGDGEHRFYAKVRDAAGNESEIVTTSIILDTTPPTAPAITAPATVYTDSVLVSLTTPSADANFGTYQLSTAGYSWQDTDLTDTFDFSLVPGPNHLGVRAVDKAGNVSGEAWVEVTYDATSFAIAVLPTMATGTTGTVRCSISRPSVVTIEYGLDASYGQSVTNHVYATSCDITLSGLTAQTDYHFRVKATDSQSNTNSTGDNVFHTGTDVTGLIGSNTTWSAAQNPIVVTGNTRVQSGATLIIEPGVEVRFNGYYSLEIEGELVAKGVDPNGNGVRFTSNYPTPAPGDWDRIWFKPSSVDAVLDADGNYVSGSVLDHVDVAHGRGIFVEESSPAVTDSSIHDMSGWSLSCGCIYGGAIAFYQASSVFQHNDVASNSGFGICVHGGGPTITRSAIHLNNGGGMELCATTSLVEDNTISGNSAHGGYAGGIDVLSGSPRIRHNALLGNSIQAGSNVGCALGLWMSLASPEITNNIIAGSCAGEAAITISDSASSSLIFGNNNITNATTYELKVVSGAPEVTWDASSNWWGTTDTSAVNAKIWDHTDDYNVPTVTVAPFLAAPEITAGPRP